MNQESLYNHFRGGASDEELSAVRKWVETDPKNRESYLKQREIFDIIQLAEVPEEKTESRKTISISLRGLIRAAVLAGIVLLSGIYFVMKEQQHVNLAMNSITVPAGQRVNLVLSDGTRVWLNSRTEFSYPAAFSGKNREVFLDGEAYFEVNKRANETFVVHAGRGDIEVLGTKFNVEAYSDADAICTSLLEGSIRMVDKDYPDTYITLSPGNLAYLNKQGEMSANPIENYDLYRWRDGLICFKDTKFGELARRFEKCYGIRIIIKNEKLLEYECSGKFRISDGIDYALRLLQKDAKYTFERNTEDTEIYIK